MGKKGIKHVLLWAAVLGLCGCHAQPDAGLTSGKVVAVGKTHLILDDGKSVLFVDIDEAEKERLKDLKKGDKVTLVTAPEKQDDRSVEVKELITASGEHIPLGG